MFHPSPRTTFIRYLYTQFNSIMHTQSISLSKTSESLEHEYKKNKLQTDRPLRTFKLSTTLNNKFLYSTELSSFGSLVEFKYPASKVAFQRPSNILLYIAHPFPPFLILQVKAILTSGSTSSIDSYPLSAMMLWKTPQYLSFPANLR